MAITITIFHGCSPLFVLSGEKILREKAERILSTPTGLATSVSLKMCPQSVLCVCCSLCLCRSQRGGGGVLSNSNSFAHFLVAVCFLGIKSHVLDSKRCSRSGRESGACVRCCNTMNEQERNLGDWQGNTWNIQCGLTYLGVVKTLSVT